MSDQSWHKLWKYLDSGEKAILFTLRDLNGLTNGGPVFQAAYDALSPEMQRAYDIAFKGGTK